MPRVAFIGLGRMGHGMAGRYLDEGFALTVWNRSKSKADDLIARGARWATSPEDAAIDADAVVTMVADDEASREVWLTKDGAAATMKAGTLAIECSTVSHAHALAIDRLVGAADRHDDAAPVGVLAGEGGLDQGALGDRAGDPAGRGGGGGAGDGDLDELGRALPVPHQLLGEVEQDALALGAEVEAKEAGHVDEDGALGQGLANLP